MSDKADVRIDLDAVRTLIEWKSLFADEVVARARHLAVESGQALVTVSHYRQAAQLAMRSLSTAISEGDRSSDDGAAA